MLGGSAAGFASDQPALVLLVVITLGLVLGRIRVAGLALGSSGVIFVALAAGHWGFHLPKGIGSVGLVLFIYCIGLAAGPTFFRAFKRQGARMSVLGIVIVALGAATACACALLLNIPKDLAAGIFTGALTSTPGLAAGLEALPPDAHIGVGFGLAYPFGLVGVVLFVHLYPRLIGVRIEEVGRESQPFDVEDRRIVRVLVKVLNPAVFGRKLSDLVFIRDYNCQISRMLVGNRLVPIPADLMLAEGQHLLLVARAFRLPPVIQLLGERDDQAGVILDTEDQSLHVVATDRRIVGRSLFELNLRSNFGVTVTRIMRNDLEFVPRLADRVQYGDMLNVVGEHADLEKFAEYAGHRARVMDETDLISLGVGIAAGVALGNLDIGIGGKAISLGLAGGPLLAGLLLAHVGRVGPVRGHLPRAARLLLTEIGLVLLLADAGVRAGAAMGGVVSQYGLALCLASAAVMVVPMVGGALLARFAWNLPLLQILGGICGGMTSTPGIGAVTSQTESEAPVVSYAAAYPVALIMMTIFVRLLVCALH